MKKQATFKYTMGEDDNAYACPLETVENNGRVEMGQLDDCIEADVVGRYSGNIEIVNR